MELRPFVTVILWLLKDLQQRWQNSNIFSLDGMFVVLRLVHFCTFVMFHN